MMLKSSQARAEAICHSCNCTLESVKKGGRKPEIVAVRWEIINTLHREGVGVKEIAQALGINFRTCGDYLRGKVHASRDVVVRDVVLDPELKKVRREEHDW